MYEVKELHKVYSQGEQQVTALSDVNLKLDETGFVAIVGESGSGKTTLLNILAGFDKTSGGTIYFQGNKLDINGENKLTSYYRDNVGFVFQEYNVINELTIEENVELPLNILDIDEKEKKRLVHASLEKVGLSELKTKKVGDLSGGQKQRVAIARAYVKNPKVILADEPTGNLDYDNSIRIFEMLSELSKSVLIIMVTHNRQLALSYADRIISLSDGKVVADKELRKEEVVLKLTNGQVEEYVEEYSQIINFVRNNTGDKFELIIEKSITSKKNEIEEKIERKHYRERELSFREKFRISNKVLAKRRIRQIISIGIFAITTLLLLVGFNLFFYDEDTVVKRYLEDNNKKELFVFKKVASLNGDSDENEIYVSKDMKDSLNKICQDGVFFEYRSALLSKNGMLSSGIEEQDFSCVIADVLVFSEAALLDRYSITEIKSNEIIITEELAKKINIHRDSIGKEFYLDEQKVVLREIVCGLEDAVFVSPEYIEIIKKMDNCISINGNFLMSKSLFEYAHNMISITTDETVAKLITEKSQVVLSTSFAEGMDDVIGKTFYLKDLYQDAYKDSFSEYMNLYDYLGTKVSVVGVADFDGDVCVSEEVFTEIKNDYYDVFVYNKIGIYQERWDDIVKSIHHNKMRVDDEKLNDVYDIVDMKPNLLKYIALALILMIVLTVFIMISIIGYSIEDNSRIIGILKSLGISTSDIKNIFIIQPIIIIAISFVLALVALIVLVNYINAEYIKQNAGVVLNIIHVNPISVIVALILAFAIGTITVILPLKEMDKKTIVETLRN